MATPLFPTQAQRRKYPVEFKAGQMHREENTNLVKPDLRKGMIYMDQGEDGLMHFYWRERKSTQPEVDLYVFPDDVEFVRVPQAKTGRVYMLHFKASGEKKFFWAQDAKDDKDEEYVTKVNRLINEPQAALAESRRQQPGISSSLRNLDELPFGMSMDQEQLLQLLQPGNTFSGLTIPSTTPANEPQQSSTASAAARTDTGAASQQTEQTVPTGVTPEQLGTLRNILSEIQVPEGTRQSDLNLADVLTPSAIGPLLSNSEISNALFPYLPQNLERSPEELREVVQSPQFQQALASLSIALQSEQVGPLLTSLGLDRSAGNGVEAFLRAIQQQAQRQQEQSNSGQQNRGDNRNNQDDQGGDRMEED